MKPTFKYRPHKIRPTKGGEIRVRDFPQTGGGDRGARKPDGPKSGVEMGTVGPEPVPAHCNWQSDPEIEIP